MTKRIRLITLSVLTLAVLGSGLATHKAEAACSVSAFRITWPQVAVRELPIPNGNILGYRYHGQVVYGPIGGTYNGWTLVQSGRQNPPYGYIPESSRNYLGCS